MNREDLSGIRTVLSVIGTRPEAIKMAPVIKELEKFPQKIRSIVCVTGQHNEMLQPILKYFKIVPDYDLNVMAPDQRLDELFSLLVARMSPVINEVNPNWVLAQGDTVTVLAAAISCYYNRIKFGHVEAGLRTNNKFKPFPEEMNRRLADSLADAMFAPTEKNRSVLIREGYDENQIFVTGNTVIDALNVAGQNDLLGVVPDELKSIPFDKDLVLVTAHRRESFGDTFREICSAIRELTIEFEDCNTHFVYPVHLNPNVRRPVEEILSNLSNMSLIAPLDYFSLIYLMKRSKLILTDSGGIQEEAPGLNVPVIVLREETERLEGVEAGVAKLAGTSRENIIEATRELLTKKEVYQKMAKSVNPYGDGKAAQRIVSILLKLFQEENYENNCCFEA